MRHRLEPVLVLDALDDLDRLLARGAAGAVGDGHERGLERLELRRAPRTGCALPPRFSEGRTRRRTPVRPRRGSGRFASDDYAAQRSGSPGTRSTSPIASQVREVGEHLREQPLPVLRRERVPVDGPHHVEGAQRLLAERRRGPARGARSTSTRLPWMWACTSANVRPWPDRHSRAPSRSTLSSELQELARRVRRVAELEVQRDAPEQVVARDQQPPLGLEQADVRGRVAGRLVRDPLPQARGDADARRAGRDPARTGPAKPDPDPPRPRSAA